VLKLTLLTRIIDVEAIAIAAWHGMVAYAKSILIASTFCLTLELIASHNRPSLASRIRGAFFWFVYIAITASFFAIFNAVWSKLHVKPLVNIDVGILSHTSYPVLHVLGWIFAPIAGSIVGEFFYYWFHRAQHTFPTMWRFHAVHHSLREMNGFNNNHHFTEEIFRIPFITVPMSLFVGVSVGYVPAIIMAIIGLQSQYEHSTTKLNLGWFRYVVADNRYHRIHHTINRNDWGHNFGSFVPFWDIVFRTAKFPQKGEWPDVGIPGVEEASTLQRFLFMPFTRKRLDGSDSTDAAAPIADVVSP
jgi:sterol desaturase/sphingolipid hydroxylase (fatty acid hydroxylase superfamily)